MGSIVFASVNAAVLGAIALACKTESPSRRAAPTSHAATRAVDVGQLHACARDQPGHPTHRESDSALGDFAQLVAIGAAGREEDLHFIAPSVANTDER